MDIVCSFCKMTDKRYPVILQFFYFLAAKHAISVISNKQIPLCSQTLALF